MDVGRSRCGATKVLGVEVGRSRWGAMMVLVEVGRSRCGATTAGVESSSLQEKFGGAWSLLMWISSVYSYFEYRAALYALEGDSLCRPGIGKECQCGGADQNEGLHFVSLLYSLSRRVDNIRSY